MSLRSLFCLFLSGPFTQVLLYAKVPFFRFIRIHLLLNLKKENGEIAVNFYHVFLSSSGNIKLVLLRCQTTIQQQHYLKKNQKVF